MKKAIAIAAGLVAVLLGSSWVAAQAERGNAKNGQAIYAQHCLRCHGVGLDGKGPDARDLIVLPANLQSVQSRSKADWELLITITNGVLFSPMHGWRGRLTDEQILDVLSYIRTMAPFEAIS
jgi:cytochrome c oxidase cbb3-type subunit 3